MLNKKLIRNYSFCFLWLCAVISCKPNKLKVDVSSSRINIKIERLDKELMEHKEQFPSYFAVVAARYKDFWPVYCQHIVHVGTINDPMTANNMVPFLHDKEVQSVFAEVDKKFPDLTDLEKELSGAWSYYKHYFPAKPVPRMVAFVGLFNYSIVETDNTLGIGLDNFLGPAYKNYAPMGFPFYRIRLMDRKYIALGAMKGWAQSEFGEDPRQKELIYKMIYNGKILYFLDAMMPETDDTLKIGYTEKQMKWCHNNEENIWSYLIDKKILFSGNANEYGRFVNEGPSTKTGLPKESPSMLGSWLGWQIVRAYMENNPSMTLEKLMKEEDARKILNESGYKPKK